MSTMDSLPIPSPDAPEHSALVRAALRAQARARPELLGGLAAGAEGLREALAWSAQGVGADETACVWLGDLRWARALGLSPEEAAPVPPEAWWEPEVARLAPADFAERHPLLARALCAGDMPYPARTPFTELADDTFLPRLAVLPLHPREGLEQLGQLAVNLTALTHGHPEALAAGLVIVLHRRALIGLGAEEAEALGDAGDGADPQHRAPAQLRERARRRVLELLSPRDPGGSAPSAGLLASYGATGATRSGLARILAAAPLSAAVLADPDAAPTAQDRGGDEVPGCVRALARELTGPAPQRPGCDPGDGGTEADAEARSEAEFAAPSEAAQSPTAWAELASTDQSAEQLADRLTERWVESVRRWWEVWGTPGR